MSKLFIEKTGFDGIEALKRAEMSGGAVFAATGNHQSAQNTIVDKLTREIMAACIREIG